MEVTITVDFGMTGSAAEWWTHPYPKSGNRVDGTPHLIGKIPTKLAYGESGNVIAWGSACEDDKNLEVCQNFKTLFNTPTTFSTEGSQGTTGPRSFGEVERWCADYLRQFSRHIIGEITRGEGISQQELIAEWHLTTPGSWSAATQRDFKDLCSGVLSDLSPNPKIIVNLTEAQASCEYLTDTLKPANGAWIITCDIGGATTDVALAVVMAEDGVLIPEVYPITGNENGNAGVCRIDKKFLAWISDYALEDEGLTETLWWRYARHSFDGSKEVLLPAHYVNQNITSSGDDISGDRPTIKIPIDTMKEFFGEFRIRITSDIERAIEKVKELDPLEKPIIALCGGGGMMKLLSQWLEMRFDDYEIILPPSPEQSCLATIIGHRIYLKRHAINKFLGEVEIGISDASSNDSILWKDPTRVTTYDLRSRKQVVTHYFIVKCRPATRPSSVRYLSEGLGPWPGTSVWTLRVTLGQHWVQGRKYCFEVICTGRGCFGFRAYDTESPGTTLKSVSKVLLAGK